MSAAALAGRVALVTGGSSDIGRAIAAALARAGADLVLIGREPERLRPLAAEVEGLGRHALLVRCDVTSAEDVAATVADAGPVDILVNAVGGTGGSDGALWETSPGAFRRLHVLNLESAFLTMAAAMPGMVARRWGRVVNIGGSYGLRGRAGRAAYSAAKWGLRGLTKSAAVEAGPYGVTVNCVCPGMVEGSRFNEAAGGMAEREGFAATEAKERILLAYPSRRASRPDEIAAAVLFLAGEAAAQITGQDLAVDGGWSAC